MRGIRNGVVLGLVTTALGSFRRYGADQHGRAGS